MWGSQASPAQGTANRRDGSSPESGTSDPSRIHESVRSPGSVTGVRSTRGPLRRVAERALEHDDAESRVLAAQLLEVLGRIPVLRP
jgi:hypothetical protein